MEHLERKGWFCKVIEFKNIFIKKKKFPICGWWVTMQFLMYLYIYGHMGAIK